MNIIKTGTWGGSGGRAWDDGVFTGIRQIIIYLSENGIIESIKTEYDLNGKYVWSDIHGGTSKCVAGVVKLEFPQEVITKISGQYSDIGICLPYPVVNSLCFETNKRYGRAKGNDFSLSPSQGMVVGFHGSACGYLDAIGLHLSAINDAETSSETLKVKAFTRKVKLSLSLTLLCSIISFSLGSMRFDFNTLVFRILLKLMF
ncbi:hypothetical protein AMTR_s00002p00249120 [Amborella trichopoda]|uniref:Jacalin-type lectin domain-containing protein n=1 Tax=Amborella trichopoda TaxID=13333 RepID=W1P014_AMBTC|nr:hypothetical protein AMTR_s00002p00249120 [Amborella trichopoda]